MTPLPLRDNDNCRYDIVALGEVMLRLDPLEGRIHTAAAFSATEGGGEYNVARGSASVFGLKAGLVTALADNAIGRLLESRIRAGNVDTSMIRWVDSDGVGRHARNGLNFTERGFGVRAAVGVSDRGHTAIAQLGPDEVDWDALFGQAGVRWFHTGGIYAALSPTSALTALAAVRAAKRHDVIVSYDLNYRPSLWQGIGGQAKAQEVNRELAPHIDVMIGNEEDFTAALGFEVPGIDANFSHLPVDSYARMIAQVADVYPNLRVIATTLRTVRTASSNDWGALAWSPETGIVQSTYREALEILDRVGGGDSFASGLIYGLITGEDLATAVEYGAAHGALAMTTPGDTSMATKAEMLRLAAGGSARVRR